MSERASIFDAQADFDVSDFQPRKEGRGGGTPSEIVRAVSEASQFTSREPAPIPARPVKEQPRLMREPRRHRTGRNVQLNIKVRAETLDCFYAMADRHGWVLGETLERAVLALEKELAGSRAPG
jgi:hypothetical protein